MASKLVIGIFISICAIFVMSHNASAIDFVLDLDNYTLSRNDERRILDLAWNGNTSCINVNYCEVFDSVNVSRVNLLKNGVNASYNDNSIVIWRVLVGSQLHDGYSNAISLFNQKNFTTNNDNLIFLGYNQKTVDRETVYTTFSVAPDNTYVGNVVSSYHNFTIYEYYFKVLQGGQYKIGFESTGSSITSDIFDLTAYNNSKIMFMNLSVQAWSPVESKENKEVEEKTQEAVEQSAESGESSQGSVEGSTQNLMSAGASIISALSNAPATDCNINMTTSGSSSAFTGAIGSVNLCSGVPSGVLTMVQGIVALVFTPIVLYYTYSIITTIYKQFKEYNS